MRIGGCRTHYKYLTFRFKFPWKTLALRSDMTILQVEGEPSRASKAAKAVPSMALSELGKPPDGGRGVCPDALERSPLRSDQKAARNRERVTDMVRSAKIGEASERRREGFGNEIFIVPIGIAGGPSEGFVPSFSEAL